MTKSEQNGEAAIKSLEATEFDAGSFYCKNCYAGVPVPEGYVLVPKEPTEAMIEAGYLAVMATPVDEERPAKVCYKAMIEAAQEVKE